jgi:hypothetical protein
MIAVIELEPEDDGFVATLQDVRGSDDIESLPSLQGFTEREARVRMGDVERTITVYEKNGVVYARLADLTV